MPKIQKFETQVNWLWYEAEITDEQAKEYSEYEAAIAMNGNAEEPEWLYDLDWDLTRDKPGNDDVEYTIADNGEYLVDEEAINYEETEFGKLDE